MLYPYPVKKILIKDNNYFSFYPEPEIIKAYFLKKGISELENPEKSVEFFKNTLSLSDFKDSSAIMPYYIFSMLYKGKKVELDKFKEFLNPSFFCLLKALKNIKEEKVFYCDLKDSILSYIFLYNAFYEKSKNFNYPLSYNPESIYLYALYNFVIGDIKKAYNYIEIFFKEEKFYKSNLYDDAIYLKSMINRFQNNKEAEKELLLRLEREFPFYPFKSEVILRLISIYYEDQKWEKILEFKTKAEKFIKKLVPYFYYAYIFTGKFEKGDSLLFNYLDSYQKRDSLRIKVSYLLFRNRKTGDALRVLEKVENKNSLDFLYLKIDILARRNKETELIRLYNTVKSRKLKGKIAEVLGNYYLKRNKLKEAELFFRKAYEYLPERDALLFSYLFARWKRGEIKEEQVYREFLDKAKDVEEIKKIRFEYHYYLLKKGKLKEAEKNLSFLLNILEKDEKIMRALKELYEIELYLKHDSFFIEILNKFKNREELMGFVYWLGTRYFIERGLSIDKVFGFLEGIHRVKQDDFYYPYILYNLSRCYVEEKKYKEAQVLLEELCERKDSLGFNALFLMGRIYIYQKNVRELKRVIDKLTQVVDRENSPEIYFLKAELESILGNLEKAMEFYEKAAVLYGERRNKAAEMLLRAALISEGIRREFYLKRALILAEDKSLITEIEDFLKR